MRGIASNTRAAPRRIPGVIRKQALVAHDSLAFDGAIISPSVKKVKAPERFFFTYGGFYFSTAKCAISEEDSGCESIGGSGMLALGASGWVKLRMGIKDWAHQINARAFGDPVPRKKPAFPYKPPANRPPRRKPVGKRTPIDIEEFGDVLPVPDPGILPYHRNRTSLP